MSVFLRAFSLCAVLKASPIHNVPDNANMSCTST